MNSGIGSLNIAFQKIGVQTLVWQNQAKAGRLRPKYLSDKL